MTSVLYKICDADAFADMLAKIQESHGVVSDDLWSDVMRAYRKARYGVRLRFITALEQRSPELVERIMKEESGC